jgi:transcriptional regulator with XRE-family HTH domain
MPRRPVSDAEFERAAQLGKLLERQREALNLTVPTLAAAADVKYETVRAVLAGKNAHPSYFTVCRLAAALKIPPTKLTRIGQRRTMG